MRISTETIYRWVYAAAQFGDTSYRHLRRAHKRRRRQARYGQGRRLFPGRIDISQRPGIVAGRTRFGDWEADLVCTSKGKAALLSCTERRSRFLLLARVQDRTAASFNAALIPCLRAVPPKLRQTLTLDNGSEMAGFRALEAQTRSASQSPKRVPSSTIPGRQLISIRPGNRRRSWPYLACRLRLLWARRRWR